MEISLSKLLMKLIKKSYIIVILALLVGIVGYAVTELFIDEEYSSSSSYSISATVGVKDSDVAKRYVTVGKYDVVLNKMIEDESIAKLGMDKAELRSSLVLSANNEVFTAMSVVNDAETARTILRVFDDVAIPEITSIIREQFAMHDIELIYEAGTGVKISPNTLKNTLISFIAGLFLGVIAITVPYIVVRRIENEGDLMQVTERNVIANIPHVDVGNDGICTRIKRFFSKESITTSPILKGNENYVKAITLMRYKLDMLTKGKFIVLTGTKISSGVTSIALSLAKDMTDKRVLIIETGNSSLRECFGNNKKYLEDYLENCAELDEVLIEVDKNVDIISSNGSNNSAILSKYKELSTFGEEYDRVIIDTLPIVSEPNALAMTALTKDILLVVPNGESVTMLNRTMGIIGDMGLSLVGVVLNNTVK